MTEVNDSSSRAGRTTAVELEHARLPPLTMRCPRTVDPTGQSENRQEGEEEKELTRRCSETIQVEPTDANETQVH